MLLLTINNEGNFRKNALFIGHHLSSINKINPPSATDNWDFHRRITLKNELVDVGLKTFVTILFC